MSEHQSYEFLALDRPLTQKQMTELREISTRADISPTRFWNEHQYGDLKADPSKLMARYFDAHLYFANWGTRRLMLRVPKARVDVESLKAFFVGRHAARLTVVGEHVLMAFTSDTEEPEYDTEDQGSLAALSSLRLELMRGDVRCGYLAWLLSVQADDVRDGALEPPVPTGLANLTAAQEVMVEFLRIDVDLLAAAARGSAKPDDDDGELGRWVTRLPRAQKDEWLLRAALDHDLALGGEMLRAFRATRGAPSKGKARTVRELLAAAETERAARENAEAARAKKAIAVAERQRQRRLDKLACDVDTAWAKLERLVAASKYEEAVPLAVDLRDLAIRQGAPDEFAGSFEAMRKRQLRRRGFFDQWKRQNATARRDR